MSNKANALGQQKATLVPRSAFAAGDTFEGEASQKPESVSEGRLIIYGQKKAEKKVEELKTGKVKAIPGEGQFL
ncbi:MAG: hypothetical protein GY795_15780 [Desulfobacterales bacterium]|nr:hypothetical protein [Desulfobacterales bacterium]